MSLDDLWQDEEPAPRQGARRRALARTFALAVVAAAVCVVLLALVLYALGVGGAALWDGFWDDFA